MKSKYDVIIIGGGPAGSTLGSYLAKANIDCVIFEKEKFPRPHVGESLVASSTKIFQELNLIPKLENAGFLKKYGAVWTTEKNENIHGHDWEDVDDAYQMEVQFKDRKIDGVKQNYTYHVNRALFDEILLTHSKELGCQVYQEHHIFSAEILTNEVKIKVRNKYDDEINVSSKIVVDATGRNTFFGTKKKWKIKDPVYNQCAVHTWFKNYDRTPIEEENITIHFLPVANSWIWQIPITDDITSVGIVAQKEHFVSKKDELDDYFWDMVNTRPEIYQNLKNSDQIKPLKIEGDYSYAMEEITDDRLLLIGDAARFVDPIFASGISIAMQSAKFASTDIIEAINSNNHKKSAFSSYCTKITKGCENWHEFISLYYRLNVMFTYFLSSEKYRFDVIKFLQGDVYDDENPKLLIAMKEFVEAVENNSKHPLHNYLGNLTANKFSL